MRKLLYPFCESGKIFHRVAKSESLFDIALRYGTTVHKIILLNRLTSPPIPHTVLYIEKGQNPLYIFKPSDSADKLAAKYNVSADELYKLNETSYFYPFMLIELPEKKNIH